MPSYFALCYIMDHRSIHKCNQELVLQEVDEKMVTLRKDLLLSFVFFDTNQCGYIKGSDLSDIIHSIGLGLSRSQVS